MESLGTADFDFYAGLLTQLANVGTQEKTLDERGTNFMLAMVRGIGPKDEIEAMMAAQMAAVHMTTMTFARRLAQVDNIPQQDSAERAFNKLARTFAVQVEALKRYRTGVYQAFPAAEARRLAERFEWHYTPKHGSWLNMAETELSVLSGQCLDRRIPDKAMLTEEAAAWTT